jgi:hypothetical protein
MGKTPVALGRTTPKAPAISLRPIKADKPFEGACGPDMALNFSYEKTFIWPDMKKANASKP